MKKELSRHRATDLSKAARFADRAIPAVTVCQYRTIEYDGENERVTESGNIQLGRPGNGRSRM